jgi:hypothetical protein
MTLKAKPPKPPADDRDERIAAIISGATAASPAPSLDPTQQPAPQRAVSAPWKAPHVRQDVLVQLNIRIPESLSLKLKHLSNVTDRPKQDIVAEALASLLDAELLKIGFTKEDI